MRVYSPSKNHSISFLFAQFTIVCISILMTSSKHSAVVGLASKSVSAAVQKASASTTNNVYYWFRLGDLRLHDNPGFNRAVADYCCAANNTQPKIIQRELWIEFIITNCAEIIIDKFSSNFSITVKYIMNISWPYPYPILEKWYNIHTEQEFS